MKRSTFALCAAFVTALPLAAAAADPAAPPAATQPAPPPLVYDDPAMHFAAPADWEGIRIPPVPDDEAQHTVAFFVKDRGESTQRTIGIDIGPFSGTLDDLVSVQESELRKQYEGAFIDRKARVLLANGMPAWWLRVSYGTDLGRMYERYEYIVFDGRRGIVASHTAHRGEAQEKEARAALGTLSVVLYPRGR
jgi:hypothetical protein